MVLVLDTIQKQKYVDLFSSYILEIENYKKKRNLLVLDLSSVFRLYNWEGVRHLTCLVKPNFFTLVAMIISYHSRGYVIQEHVIEKKSTQSTQDYDETLL